MAIGDKLFLADKPTLDDTKTTLDVVKSTLDNTRSDTQSLLARLGALSDGAGTTSVISYLKNIWSALSNMSSSTKKDYFTADDVVNKYRAGRVVVNNLGETDYVSAEGPGEIYAIIYTTTSSTAAGVTNTFKIIVDDTTVYNYSTNTYSIINAGLITRDALLGSNTQAQANVYVPGARPVSITDRQLILSSSTSHSDLMYLPKPLRFENSLKLRTSLSTTGATITNNAVLYYMYKLD